MSSFPSLIGLELTTTDAEGSSRGKATLVFAPPPPPRALLDLLGAQMLEGEERFRPRPWKDRRRRAVVVRDLTREEEQSW